MQLGPKAKDFLTNRSSFILKIRSAKKGVGAVRSKKDLQLPSLAPTISTRKKRTRLEAGDDLVESFTPTDTEANFDDIEAGPEPHEPPTPPLVQARKLRASPSVQFVEHRTEDALDPNQECFRALCVLRNQVRTLCIQCSLHAQIVSILVCSGVRLQRAGHPC
jgi:hypothetical protein